jgi:hypothetical protein
MQIMAINLKNVYVIIVNDGINANYVINVKHWRPWTTSLSSINSSLLILKYILHKET